MLCLLLLVVFCLAWAAIAVFAFAHGNPFQLVHPSNSEGEICGRGEHADKPNLLFFDLTRCIKISAAVGGCATPQVCVRDCPASYWTYTTGKSEGLADYCRDLAAGEFEASSVQGLVKQRKCPAYLVPSQPFLGRCVPTFGLARANNVTTRQVERMQTSDGSNVDSDNLKKGIEYIMKAIDAKGRLERLMADLASNWWMLVLGLLFAMLVSLGWILLLRLACKPVIWASIVLCLALLVAATTFSWWQYSQLAAAGDSAGEDDIFLPPVVSTLSGYYYNKTTWLVAGILLATFTLLLTLVLIFLIKRIQIAIELIEEASKAVGEMPSILFFPVFPFLVQLLVILWFLAVGSFLVTSGSKEYKVVDMTATATYCVNNATGQLYQNNEECQPDSFRAGCPDTSCTSDQCPTCVFHKYGPSTAAALFQVNCD